MSDSHPAVALVGSLDTKHDELVFARSLLQERGVRVVLVDVGVLGEPATPPDVAAHRVAAAAGSDLRRLRDRADENGARADAISTMAEGAAVVVHELVESGEVDGVLGIGGGQGSTIASAALRAIPLGVPKVLLTTMSPDNLGAYFGESDLCVLYSVGDISGLNRVTRTVIRNAVGAVVGMVTSPSAEETDDKPLVGISMFGTTTRGAHEIQVLLENEGFETVAFHAVGSGGRALEGMIRSGEIAAVVDLTPSEVTDDVFGGIFSAGPDRMRASVEKGIPTVIVPGALGQITFGPRATVPSSLDDGSHTVMPHSPSVTIVRANSGDVERIGRAVTDRLAGAENTVIAIPLRGISDYERPGAPLDDAQADSILFSTLRESAPPAVPVLDRDTDINSPEFAAFVVGLLLDLWRSRATATSDHTHKENQ